MKTAIMIATVPSMIGQFNMNNIRILQELGYEVHVACNFHDTSVWTVARTKEFLAELKEKRICYHQIDFPRKPSNIKSVFSAYRQLMNLVRNEEYDLIHCHTPIAGVIGRLVAHKRKIKVIYTAHGFHFYQGAPFINWIFYYPIEWLCSWWTDVLITINKEDYKRAKSKFHAKKTEYVPGIGADTQNFAICTVNKDQKRKDLDIPINAKLLISVGELSVRKNHKVVIEALVHIHDDNIYYIIAGNGELESELRKQIDTHGLKKRVRLLGYRTDIRELLCVSDVFVFPSLQEGLPVALMEAMASGLPIVCSRIRGNTDLIDEGKGGDFFDPFEIDDVARTIQLFFQKGQEEYGTYNRMRVSQFDLAVVHNKMEEIYLTSGIKRQ